jgi:FAD/FMN-containing dehydrogenase
MICTTLKAIKEYDPCSEGWKKLLKHLGKTKCDEEPLPLVEILKSNGLDDALWCLRSVDHKSVRLYAVACAREVQHLMTDERSLKALDVAEAYVNGQATEEELEQARNAACDATDAAAKEAYYAADAAAKEAYYAAYDAAYAAYAVAKEAYYAAYATHATAAIERQAELFIQFFGE